MHKSVLAVAAHPDDIEFVMVGTMLQLVSRGWQAHYFNIANGCCGSAEMDRATCAAVRLKEAQSAAAMIPASFYPPLCDDLEIFYTSDLHRRVSAVVRESQPTIILTHAPSDYMEDHQNAARLAVAGAFTRAMPNFTTQPPKPTYGWPVAVYHAQPHGNRDPLGVLVEPTHVVDVGLWIDRKRQLLAQHQSQDQWLDATQGISAYLETMTQLNAEVARIAARKFGCGFQYAEGWRKHLHLGMSDTADFDPLAEALGDEIVLEKSCNTTE